ncbi:MAG: arylesterase [Rhodospirillales bacterium]|nr:arylesterase [Rhodospirillales bacterium]
MPIARSPVTKLPRLRGIVDHRPPRGYGARTALVNLLIIFAFILVFPRIGAAADGAPRLLMLGDSLTAGYGLSAQQALPVRLDAALRAASVSVEVINAGVSGDTTAGGLSRLDWVVGSAKPQFAIVALGANDGLRGLDPRAMFDNLDRIVGKLQAQGIRVLLAGMYAPPNFGRDYAAEFNGVFPRLAAKHKVPLYPFLLEGVATHPALNQADGIHPNAAGVETIVRRLLPEVKKLLSAE